MRVQQNIFSDKSYNELNLVNPSAEELDEINDIGIICTEQIPMSDTV